MALSRVCVYCGSKSGVRDDYLDAARRAGKSIAARGIDLVYGGGHVGLMGAVADAAMEAGGHVTGVITRQLVEIEVGHEALSELRVVADMPERKKQMFELADAFVVLPGGIGTLEETFEVLSWAGLGIHDKPIGLLDVARYFDPLTAFLDHSVAEGFLSSRVRSLLLSDPDCDSLLDRLAGVVETER